MNDDYDRFFVSVDTTQMNKILWIDKKSMFACIEAGIAGQDLEKALQKQGVTLGHDPDSIELSTLGKKLNKFKLVFVYEYVRSDDDQLFIST